jgi:hypothetical protein
MLALVNLELVMEIKINLCYMTLERIIVRRGCSLRISGKSMALSFIDTSLATSETFER